MRGSLLPARLLAAVFVAAVVAALSVSAALATSSTVSANGLSVTASLSPDAVTKGQTVTQVASVKNASDAKESVTIRIFSALASASPATFSAVLQPGATFSRSVSFPAALLKVGTHTLTVVAINGGNGGSAQATASITRS
jgi:precorrin-6x reductase